ncbi:aldehyde-activating protein [Sorangium cellulosum]|uniref:Aldehyde-activating protein n=1 Tax=Sorangium cellulosum TaxID=56 RepID=A0A2L0FBL6_SORCE|nr:GFA family protein [Sorangium cellulosum]AUX48897.1 aldehyde-activating protein [Sorangium cellulosum]
MAEVEQEAGSIPLTGGCQCGRVRYRADAIPGRTGYCHCRQCQRAFGNVFAVLTSVRRATLAWLGIEPTYFASSPLARRGFCSSCGTPLTFEYPDSEVVEIAVGSLDDPGLVRPTSHSGVESQVAWLALDDGLPRRLTEEDPAYRARCASLQGSGGAASGRVG